MRQLEEKTAGEYSPFTTHNGRLIKRRLYLFSWEGALANVFIVLTGGAFLTSMGIYFGANDFEIGLLGALPFLSQTAQLMAPWLIHLTGNRKLVTVGGFVGARQIMWLLLPLFFMTSEWRLPLFLIIITVSAVAAMTSTPGWLSWIADVVPHQVRGRYFGRRNSAIAVSTVAATILGGLILDHYRLLGKESTGFSIIIGAAAVFAIVSAILLSRLPDIKRRPSEIPFNFSVVFEPLRNRRYRHLLAVFFFWNMAIGISAIFFAAHMLTNLHMSFFLISLYTSATATMVVLMNKFWGAMIDRFGSRAVLVVCALGISFIPMIWFIPRADFLWILAIESIYTGALWAGFNLAAFNIPIANSPQEKRTGYLAMFSVVTGLGFFIASLLGGVIAESFSDFHLQVGKQVLVNYHILFGISSLLRIIGAFLFISFHEPGEKSLPVMVQFIGYAALKQLTVGRQLFPHRIKRHQGSGMENQAE